MGALLFLPVMAVIALGAVAAADGIDHTSHLGRATRLAAVLPDGLRLADRLQLESETISSGEAGADTARLGRLRIATDAQVAAWLARLGGVAAAKDQALQRDLQELAVGLGDLDPLRADLTVRARAEAGLAAYASLIARIGALGSHLPTQREDELARHSRSFADLGVATQALLAERTALAAALAPGVTRPSVETVAALAGAETAWSAAFQRFRDASSTGVELKAAVVEKAHAALAPAVEQILTTGTTDGLARSLVLAQWSNLFSAITGTAADAAGELHSELASRTSVVRIQTEIALAAAAGTVLITGAGLCAVMRRRRRRTAAESDEAVLAAHAGRPDELLDTFLAHSRGSHVGPPEPAAGVVPIPRPRHVPRHAAPVAEPA